MNIDTLRLYLNIPQEMALLAKTGVPATVKAQEVPDREFQGEVTRTAGALEPSTRTLLAEIDLVNEEHALKPGMFTNVTLTLQSHENAIAVHPSVLETGGHHKGQKGQGQSGPQKDGRHDSDEDQKKEQQHFVWVVDDQKAHRVPVALGLDEGAWVEITEGLEGDEDLVVAGKEHLQEGDYVTASPSKLPKAKPAEQKT
jgi:multidrug efflux pump subunit AcrA (membrane-fusion protein)